jgi:hypothetical protein
VIGLEQTGGRDAARPGQHGQSQQISNRVVVLRLGQAPQLRGGRQCGTAAVDGRGGRPRIGGRQARAGATATGRQCAHGRRAARAAGNAEHRHHELKQAGTGNSSIVGIGGDPIVGSDFIDILKLYEADPDTELIVMVGEIGGDAEERAAEFIAAEVTKPVVAYIAGFTAPPGKQMGHAGAIISGSSGTAQAKKQAFEAKGVRVGTSPSEAAEIAAEIVKG